MAKDPQQKPESHKPEASHEPKKAESPKRGKEHTPMPGGCHSYGCKASAHRYNFCDEHYDQFKFGLIKKTGEPVPDYEKKFEHYMSWKSRQKSAHKVA